MLWSSFFFNCCWKNNEQQIMPNLKIDHLHEIFQSAIVEIFKAYIGISDNSEVQHRNGHKCTFYIWRMASLILKNLCWWKYSYLLHTNYINQHGAMKINKYNQNKMILEQIKIQFVVITRQQQKTITIYVLYELLIYCSIEQMTNLMRNWDKHVQWN